MKECDRHMKQLWKLTLGFLFLLMAGCGDPLENEIALCKVVGSNLTWSGDSERVEPKSYPNGNYVYPGQGKIDAYAIQSFSDAPLEFKISNLIPGEHFMFHVWTRALDRNPGMIRVTFPDTGTLIMEWQMRKTSFPPEGKWLHLQVDLTITEAMKSGTLLVGLWPTGMDSVALFDDLQVHRFHRRPIDTHHRKGVMLDQRTQNRYPVVKVGGNWWMAEDLTFPDNRNAFTFEEAILAMPNGWRIPTDKDWMDLELEMGIMEQDLGNTGGRGTNLSQRFLEGGDLGLDLKPTTEERAHAYWSSTPASDSTRWARYLPRHTGVGRAAAPEYKKLKLRCVMDRP